MSEQALVVQNDNPGTLMRHATDVAGVCREIVLRTAKAIKGNKFVRVEGWQAIATAHGCVLSIEKVNEDDDGNVTAVAACNKIDTGITIAKAEGFVGVDESTWANRPRYARRAMAQTRAMSRVARSAFAHVVVLIDSNLSTTPAEEVPDGGFDDDTRAAHAKPANVVVVQPVPPPTPKPKPAEPKIATEKTREWFIAQIPDTVKGFVTDYLVQQSKLLPTEGLEDLQLKWVPTSKDEIKKLLDAVQASTDAPPAPDADDPLDNPSDPVPPPPNVARNTAKPVEEGTELTGYVKWLGEKHTSSGKVRYSILVSASNDKGVKSEADKFLATFDSKDYETAQGLKHQYIHCRYTTNQYGDNLVNGSLQLAEDIVP